MNVDVLLVRGRSAANPTMLSVAGDVDLLVDFFRSRVQCFGRFLRGSPLTRPSLCVLSPF